MTDFEKLFNENRDFVFKYLMKLTRSTSLAEELTQETFFRAYMNYSSLRNKEKAPVWLCQIAKNTYYTWYNEQKKTVPLETAEFNDSHENIEDAFVRKELSQKALACLHSLEEPYKEVFMLSVFGGFSLKDISSIFGKSESWARVTFYRAKQKISEKMRY
ncbi:MAG: RNA polymerase sigma factor [Candidatus Avispirillum sp.]